MLGSHDPSLVLACLPLASHAHSHTPHTLNTHTIMLILRGISGSRPPLCSTPSRVAVELSSRKLVPCPGTLANRGGRGQANRG